MKNDTTVYIPIASEHFLSFLLGTWKTHGLVGNTRRTIWLKYLHRVAAHLCRYFAENIVTDKKHEDSLISALDKLQKSIKANSPEPEIECALIELCLLLLGRMPNHYRKRKFSQRSDFQLDRFRTIHYSQSYRQRAELIVATFIEPNLSKQNREGDLAEKEWLQYLRKYKKYGRFKEFVLEYRSANPDNYAILFQ